MTVYIINNMKMRDAAQYKTYVKAFMPIFQRSGGSILAIQDAPQAMEGAWPFDRTVILSFPSRQAADAWYQSEDYQAIAKHRWAGTESNIVVLDGFSPGA